MVETKEGLWCYVVHNRVMEICVEMTGVTYKCTWPCLFVLLLWLVVGDFGVLELVYLNLFHFFLMVDSLRKAFNC